MKVVYERKDEVEWASTKVGFEHENNVIWLGATHSHGGREMDERYNKQEQFARQIVSAWMAYYESGEPGGKRNG